MTQTHSLSSVEVYFQGKHAGTLTKRDDNSYQFQYNQNYTGSNISLTMPLSRRTHIHKTFPPFFDGLLPEGLQLTMLLRNHKLSPTDYLGQLVILGKDLIGAVTIKTSSSYNSQSS